MVGKTISHYKILEKLGEGGMGVVYKAEDTKLKRHVALKFLPQDLTRDTEAKERFIQEAQAASALQHSHICTIHEIDENGDGQIFICMDYYDGQTLKDKIKHSPLKIEEAIEIAIQVAEGLNEAHEKGIVHRDIKSANIMITSRGQTKIMDFGLAKLAGKTKLTKTGTTLGTVAYMSPEQTRGERVERRTDIWSLGVMMYEMITGQLPFKGDYEQAVVYSILNEKPEPMTGLRTGVPMELERIISKCLEKKAADRYQHAGELIVDLRKAEQKLDLERFQSKRAAGKRSFILPIFFLLIFVTVIGYFVIYDSLLKKAYDMITPPIEHRWENSIAVLPLKNLSPDPDQEFFCDGMTEQIISNLSQIQQLKVISRTSVMKFKNSEQLIPQIASLLNVKYILEGSVRKSQDRIRVTAQLIHAKDDFHVWSEDFDGQLGDVFKLQDDITEKIVQALISNFPAEEIGKIGLRKTSNVEAYEYLLKGKYYHENKFIVTYDDESFRLSEMMFKKAIHLDSSYALPYAALADLYHSYYIGGSKSSSKPEVFRLMNEYVDKAFGLDSTLAYNYLVKGRIHVIKNEVEEEFKCFRNVLQLNSNVGWYNVGYGRFLIRRGLYPQAIPYMSRAIELDPLVPSFYMERGFAYQYMGKFEEAENDYRKALDLEPNHVNVIQRYIDLLIDLNRLEEAGAQLDHLESIEPNTFLRAKFFAAKGEMDRALDLMRPNTNLQILSLLGMKEEAITFLKNTLDRDRRLDQSYYWLYKTNPVYENVRGDPRFQEFLKEHKKIYEENLSSYVDI